MRTAIFISFSLGLGDTTIGPQYEDFHGHVWPNFRAIDFGSKWKCQRRACSLKILFLDYPIVFFSQTLALLRTEIDNYIVQRQRAEEGLAANVSFKHHLLPFLSVDNATNSFKKTPK